MRYSGAISDADILINFAKVDRLDILSHLFKKIVIPQYVFDVELKYKAGRYYSVIIKAIQEEGSIIRVLDRKKDKAINLLSRELIEEKRKIIGPGESECAGYAKALRIPIIISDNYTEFRWLKEFITLTHRNVLVLCVHFGDITEEIGVEIFDAINKQLKWPQEILLKIFKGNQ